MAKFEFGFEEAWFRLIIKKLPGNPDLFLPRSVEKAQAILRVGKLKVGAARVWAEAAGIIRKKNGVFLLTPLGRIVAHHDPDLEEDGIWWAFHYNLARRTSPAWFYSFYFNEFIPDNFTRDELEKELRAYWDRNHDKPMTDSVFHKLIFSPLKQVLEGTRIGNGFGFWLSDSDGNYLRQKEKKHPLHRAILAYALLDWAESELRQSVHLEKLLEPGGIGKIFRLTKDELDILLVDIGEQYQKQVSWISHSAGLNSVSIMQCPPLALISTYYHELDGKDPLTALNLAKEEVKEFAT
ncbi:DUF4007 family protein [Desulfovulcanus sp.]